jgi:hypothetical protein
MANQYGLYGQGREQQQNMADAMRYREFGRQENWMPNMMNNYMAGVRGTPWQTTGTSTQTGQGKSDLMNLGGMALGLGGAALSGGAWNKGGVFA